MKPPFRADQVGSLLRPAELAAARKQKNLEAQQQAIREVVAKQEAIGLQAITDGEFSRDWWHLDFMAQLDGVTLTQNPGAKFAGTAEQPPIPAVTGIRANCRKNGDDPDALPRIYADTIERALEGRPAGMTITLHTCRGNFKSAWVAEGGYEPVAQAMFSSGERVIEVSEEIWR